MGSEKNFLSPDNGNSNRGIGGKAINKVESERGLQSASMSELLRPWNISWATSKSWTFLRQTTLTSPLCVLWPTGRSFSVPGTIIGAFSSKSDGWKTNLEND